MNGFLRKLGYFLIFSSVLSSLALLAVVFLNRFAVDNCDLADDVNTVIIGDSHTMWSIDTEDIKNVENISLNAEGYVYTYYKLQHLLSTERDISHVYLGFGYHNLSGYYDDYISGSRFTNFVHRYIGVMPVGELFWVLLKNPKDLSVAFRNILQRGGISGLKQRCTLYGSFPKEKRMETFILSSMKKRVADQYHDAGIVTPISESNFDNLNKIVALLRQNDIELTLLNTPMHRDYIESIPTEYRELYHDFINQRQLRVYEFGDLTLADTDFLPDGDHVNYSGAMLTTKRFKDYHENVHE